MFVGEAGVIRLVGVGVEYWNLGHLILLIVFFIKIGLLLVDPLYI